jgi:hypothetical protein
MNLYFRIVRRAKRRFSWELFDEQGRLAARSDHVWTSRKKVRKAIDQFKDMIENAEVVNRTKSGYPKISFTLTPYALPLLVGEPPDYLTAASAAERREDKSKEGATYRPFPIASQDTSSGNVRASKRAQSASAAAAGGSASTQRTSRRQSAAKKATQGRGAKTSASSGAAQTPAKSTSRTRKTTTGGKKASRASASTGKRKRGRTGR